MARPACLLALLASLVTLLALARDAHVAQAYNEDRPIYKWSPIWFNRYFRNAASIKRASPSSGGESGSEPAQCVTYGRRCSYWGVRMPCCETDARCLMEHCVPLADQYLYRPED